MSVHKGLQSCLLTKFSFKRFNVLSSWKAQISSSLSQLAYCVHGINFREFNALLKNTFCLVDLLLGNSCNYMFTALKCEENIGKLRKRCLLIVDGIA